MSPSTNLNAIDEDDDKTWIGGVSAISLDYGDGWCDDNLGEKEVDELASAVNSKKNSAKSNVHKVANVSKNPFIPDKVFNAYSNSTFQPEYVLNAWNDVHLKDRVSIQFKLESGNHAHKYVLTRVAESGRELVLEKNMSEDSKSAIDSCLIQFVPAEEEDVDEYLKNFVLKNPLINMHPKILSFNQAIATVNGRCKRI